MLSKKSPSMPRRFAGVALTGVVMLTGLALTASGEGMAAKVGAKVSDALPLPREVTLLPSLPAAHAALAAVQADQAAIHADQAAVAADDAARTADEARRAANEARRAGDEAAALTPPAPPAPPAIAALPPIPPVPPVPGVAPVPPVPPVPPIPPAPAARKVTISRHVVRINDGQAHAMPSRSEIEAMVPIIEVTEGRRCTEGKELVNTVEQRVTVDGKERQKISILICDKAYAHHARAEALKGLQEARNDIAREDDLAEVTRNNILANLDRQIARMRAGKD